MGLLDRLLGRGEQAVAPAIRIEDQWGKVFAADQKRSVDLEGFSLTVMADDYVGSSIIASKAYEPHVTTVLKRELRANDVFLDIGANVGFFTMHAWSVVKGVGKVISVEPNPFNVQLIYESMVRNDATGITVYPFAASDAPGIMRFANVGSNGLVVTEQSPEQRHSFFVQAAVLDELLAHEPRVSFVKIDIEAYEPFAMRGMSKLIAKNRPKILTEFHPWALHHYNLLEPTDYLEHILSFGYELFVIEDTGACTPAPSADDVMAAYRAHNEETRHLDLFARPKDG